MSIKKQYGKECTLSIDKFILKYNVNIDNGLSSEEAIEHIREIGTNEISKSKPNKV